MTSSLKKLLSREELDRVGKDLLVFIDKEEVDNPGTNCYSDTLEVMQILSNVTHSIRQKADVYVDILNHMGKISRVTFFCG